MYQLHDELIFSLSEEELHALQRVSANALQAMNLGVPVVIPRGAVMAAFSVHCEVFDDSSVVLYPLQPTLQPFPAAYTEWEESRCLRHPVD